MCFYLALHLIFQMKLDVFSIYLVLPLFVQMKPKVFIFDFERTFWMMKTYST